MKELTDIEVKKLRRKKKPIHYMQVAENNLKRTWPSTYLRRSFNGVPHLAIDTGYETFSVCYFGKSQTYRVFYPFPSHLTNEKVTRANFESIDGVREYIDNITEACKNERSGGAPSRQYSLCSEWLAPHPSY